jgi:hypothetical protein
MTDQQQGTTAVLGPPKERVKVSYNLPQVDIDALKELADWRNTTATEALRGAIATEHYIREAARHGARVLIEDSDKQLRELVFR